LLHEDRRLLEHLRASCVSKAPEVTWASAGVKLLDAYRSVLSTLKKQKSA
jgi:hypothetical protein